MLPLFFLIALELSLSLVCSLSLLKPSVSFVIPTEEVRVSVIDWIIMNCLVVNSLLRILFSVALVMDIFPTALTSRPGSLHAESLQADVLIAAVIVMIL